MSTFSTITPLVAVFALSTAPLFAADGLLIVQKQTSGGTSKLHQVQIERTRMRAETMTTGDRAQVVVFDAAAQLLRIIEPDRKTYREMTKADVDRIGGQMAAARAEMQERAKNLSPEQRERMEAMMRGRGLAGDPPAKIEYKKIGTDKVGKWTCDKYEGYRNNEKVTELCTVSPATVGVTLADFDIVKQAATFFARLTSQNADQMFAIGGPDQGYSGIPVRTTVSIGPSQRTTEIVDVSRKTFPDDSYAVPAGFQKQEFPGAGRRGRQQ